jgi:hypothetical protein
MANTIVTLSGDDAELYKAFQRIIDQQNKTDAGYKKIKDASKDAANEAKKAARDQERDENSHLDRVNSIAGSVAGMAASYLSVSSAISLVSRANAELITNQDKAIAKARELAAAQQEAAKNMAGQTPQQISDTLQKTVPEIAQATQFSDLAKLTTALGSAASIVGEDQAKGVVAASAQLTRFTPGELQTTSTATADIMAASGLKDAKEALALLASTGSVARPEQLSKLAQGAAVAVNSTIAQAPKQDRVEAAKEGVALYSKLSKVDPTGQSAATATTDFVKQVSNVFADPKVVKERTQRIEDLKLGKTDNALAIEAAQIRLGQAQEMAKFFKPDDQTREARSARLNVDKATQDVSQAELKQKRDREELQKLTTIQRVTGNESAADRDQRATDKKQAEKELRGTEFELVWQKKQIARIEAIPEDKRDKRFEQLDAFKTHVASLEALLPEQRKRVEQFTTQEKQAATDPGTFNKRLELIQRTPELRAQLGEGLTGEAKFLPLFKQLLDGQSAFNAELTSANKTITTDTKAFDAVAKSTVETPQARIVQSENASKTSIEIQQARNVEGQTRAAISGIFSEAMGASSTGLATGIGNIYYSGSTSAQRGIQPDFVFGSTEQQGLQRRLEYLQSNNAPMDQQQVVAQALQEINALLTQPERLDSMKGKGIDIERYLQRQNEIATEISETLRELKQRNGTPAVPVAPPANNIRSQILDQNTVKQ